FVKKGFAVLSFDYRHFGGSEGEPRNLISIPKLLEDWEAAVNYALTIKNVNTNKIGLWGSSFAGGHVIVTASSHPKKDRIGAVVAQVPCVDGFGSALHIIPNMPIPWTFW